MLERMRLLEVSGLELGVPAEATVARTRFEELEGLRAVACISVLVAHFNIWVDYKSPLISTFKTVFPAQLGIILFFCLSSFLMTSLVTQEYERHCKIDIKAFIMRRCLRIWPLYFFIILIATLLVMPGNVKPYPGASTSPEQWIWVKENCWKYMMFIGNWWPHQVSEYGIMWTLCVEEQFYLILPFIAAFIFRKSKKRFYLVALGCVFLGNAWRGLFIGTPILVEPPLYYLTLTYLDGFMFGAIALCLYKMNINSFLTQSSIPFFIVFLGLVFVCYTQGEQLWWGPYTYKTLLSYGLIPAAISFLILNLTLNPVRRWSYVFRTPLMKILGVLSFGIYLWHPLVHRMINIQVARMHFDTVQMNEFYYLLIFLEYFSLAVLLSALTFQFIERPFLNLRHYLYKDNLGKPNNRWNLPIQTIVSSAALSVLGILLIFSVVKLL